MIGVPMHRNPYYSNVVGNVTFVVGTENANAIPVTIQFKRPFGNLDLAVRGALWWYLSTDANGDNIAASAPTGGIAIGTDGLLIETIADKAGLMVSEADGDVDVVITDSGTPTFYLVVVLPDGSLKVSGAITFA